MGRYNYTVIYENNRGEKINLTKLPYAINIQPLLDYSWAYATRDRRRGSRVAGFNKAVASKELTLHVLGETLAKRDEAIDEFNNVIETDIYDGVAGKIWFDEWYTYGYIVSAQNTNWQYDKGVVKKQIQLVREEETWYHVIIQKSYTDKEVTEPPIVGQAKADQSVLYEPYEDGIKSYELLRDSQIVGDTYTLPYNLRKSPTLSPPYDRLLLNKVVGGTLAVNQLSEPIDSAETTYTVVVTPQADGTVNVNGTSNDSGAMSAYKSIPVISGHKYLLYMNKDVDGLSIYTSIGGGTSGKTLVRSASATATVTTTLRTANAKTYNNVNVGICTVDLTLFNSTIADYVYNLEQSTAGSGVAWLKQYYPKIFNGYKPYNAGELMSVEASAHVMTGFNQFNKTTATEGKYVKTDGTEVISASYGHSDFIPVIPNTTYYMKGYGGAGIYSIIAFDASKNPTDTIFSSGSKTAPFTATTPSSCYFVQLNYLKEQADTLCFNFSDNERNGEYEPYVSHSYPLDSDLVLRGIPKLNNGVPYYDGDEYKSDGTVTRRYGVVNLGSLSWVYDSQYLRFYAVLNTAKQQSAWNADIVCAKYVGSSVSGSDTSNDKVIGTYDGYLYVRDKSYTDAPTFKTSVNNVYAVYELKTYSTETADPYTNPQVCYKGGTEEFVADNVVPVGNEIQYALEQILGYDYPYDYKIDTDSSIDIVNPNPLGCNFIIDISGPVTDPYIKIGETRISVNVDVPDGAYLTVDSGAKTIIMTMPDGQQINCFGARNSDYYIFQLIESGQNTIVWDGTFSWALQMIEERSEPRWHMD